MGFQDTWNGELARLDAQIGVLSTLARKMDELSIGNREQRILDLNKALAALGIVNTGMQTARLDPNYDNRHTVFTSSGQIEPGPDRIGNGA
jgi:hypothetical protein